MPHTNPRARALIAALSGMLALGACNLDTTGTPSPTLTPATMALVGGGAQVGAAGNTLPLPVVIRVTDKSGVPVSFATVSFAPAASSGAVNIPATYTDTTGTTSVLWTLGTAIGVDSLVVSVDGVPSMTVTATATAGAPDSIVVVSGDAQSARAGTTLGVPLVVRVADQFGNVVSNASVSWSDDADGAFAAADAVTDANGRAQAVYTLGTSPGPQRVTVTVSTPGGAMQVTLGETGT